MHFTIDASVFELLPDLHVGLLVVRDADNARTTDNLTPLLRAEEAHVRSIVTEETFKTHPPLACWQDAHRAFGSNPNKFPPSIQALVKRVVKGGELPSINPLVDAYNVVSLRYLLPAGGEDLDRCLGDICLMRAEGSEHFVELGGTESAPPDPGEVIYRDDTGVICRKLNWREADRTKLTAATRSAVLVLESLASTQAILPGALGALEELVSRFTGGLATSVVLDATRREANW